jgi:hypothetical protein
VKKAVIFAIAAALAVAAPLFAQTDEEERVRPAEPTTSATPVNATPSIWRQEIRLQGQVFGNFFQASDDRLAEDVTAVSTQYRATVKPWGTRPIEFYGHVDYQHYVSIDRDNSYGGGVGATYNGNVHSFGAYIDRGENRASFDVGDQTAIANITMFGADYSYRLTRDWELKADATFDQQRYSLQTGNESDFQAFGASVRYRGFGRIFSPRLGYVAGTRDAVDPRDSYDDTYWYLQVISVPHPRLYLSARYRDRLRDYTTSDPTSSSFGREDERTQWMLSANYRLTDHVGVSTYYAREATDSSRVGRDFDVDLLLVGLTYGF